MRTIDRGDDSCRELEASQLNQQDVSIVAAVALIVERVNLAVRQHPDVLLFGQHSVSSSSLQSNDFRQRQIIWLLNKLQRRRHWRQSRRFMLQGQPGRLDPYALRRIRKFDVIMAWAIDR